MKRCRGMIFIVVVRCGGSSRAKMMLKIVGCRRDVDEGDSWSRRWL